MKYLSIDLETTGLNPDNCQILEIGAVYDDGVAPLAELQRFQCFVWHPQIIGEPRAMAMNARCLDAIASVGEMGAIWAETPDGVRVYRAETASAALRDFARKSAGAERGIMVAGKNVGSFDWQFLKRLSSSHDEIVWPFDFRFLDVGTLWLRPSDRVIPGLSRCLARAGLPSAVTHCALDDALQVVQLVRAWEQKNS